MLSSFRKKLLDNSILDDVPVTAPYSPSLLTHIPWTLAGQDGPFPKASYLDLRRQQNEGWAEERLVQGIALAKNPTTRSQAEDIYQQGLDVCPRHANLLTAYGALLANLGRAKEAIEMLDKAIKEDPEHEHAKLYRETILKRMNEEEEGKTKKIPPKHEMVALEEDEEMEEIPPDEPTEETRENQSSKTKEPTIHIKPSKEDPGTRGYSLVEEGEKEESSDSDLESYPKRKKKKRKKKRKRKYYYSSDDDSSDSESSRRRRKRRKRKRKRRKDRKRERREKRSHSSDEESSKDSRKDDDAEEIASKQNKSKRKRKEKKTHQFRRREQRRSKGRQ